MNVPFEFAKEYIDDCVRFVDTLPEDTRRRIWDLYEVHRQQRDRDCPEGVYQAMNVLPETRSASHEIIRKHRTTVYLWRGKTLLSSHPSPEIAAHEISRIQSRHRGKTHSIVMTVGTNSQTIVAQFGIKGKVWS